jgi:hypothetical protein
MKPTQTPTSSTTGDGPHNPFEDWPLDKSYVAKASPRRGGGWDIRVFVHDPEAKDQARLVGMTECATLKQLEEKAWDFVRALTDDKEVRVISAPDIGDDELMTRVIRAWAAMRDAKKAEAEAAKRTREVVKELRDRGLSVTDIAFLTHVSRGRVSQLLI